MENNQLFAENTQENELQAEETDINPVQEQENGKNNTSEKEEKSAIFKVFDFLEMFCWAFLIIFTIFTVFCRPCRVDGSSMNNTLEDNEMLLVSSLYSPKQGDIVVFQIREKSDSVDKMLVKRVIATEGQTVQINFNTKEVFVDGELYDDSAFAFYDTRYATLTAGYNYNADTKIFETIVPAGKVFVLGDNRNISKDSRSNEVGFVDANRVIGRVFMRLVPFTFY